MIVLNNCKIHSMHQDQDSATSLPDTRPLNAFTVDVEDYYHVNGFSDVIDPKTWDTYESRVVANTQRILRLMESHEVRGTFFILGWVAERFPDLVREIDRAGHEIGCHSYWHQLIYGMTPEEFRADLVRSCDVIEQVTGEKVRTFRAPCFSITEKSLWALDILLEEGIRIDSSVFPVYHDNYGIPDAERFPYTIDTKAGTLLEFPPSVYRIWNYNLPVAGGGYFRLYPSQFSTFCLGRINRRDQHPFMFYIHPWEVDPDQPRLNGPLKSRFRHYQNLRTTEPKLHRLLSKFRFDSMSNSLSTVLPLEPNSETEWVAADSHMSPVAPVGQ